MDTKGTRKKLLGNAQSTELSMNTNLNSNIVTVDVPEDLREDLVQVWDALFEDRQSIISKGEDLLQGETISGGYYPDQKLFHFVYVSREREKKNKKWLIKLSETEIGRIANGAIEQIVVDERPHGS